MPSLLVGESGRVCTAAAHFPLRGDAAEAECALDDARGDGVDVATEPRGDGTAAAASNASAPPDAAGMSPTATATAPEFKAVLEPADAGTRGCSVRAGVEVDVGIGGVRAGAAVGAAGVVQADSNDACCTVACDDAAGVACAFAEADIGEPCCESCEALETEKRDMGTEETEEKERERG